MQRLTIIRTSGDPDELLASKREHIDPVMRRKAGDYGLLAHIAARSDDGIVVVNLWDSEEGSQRAWEDPETQGAREAAGRNGGSTGETTFEHYEVEEYRQGGG
ncbi:MAG: hypothetical protein M3088_05955 [Actinomycetota bacterium]|nr:hypothetical protein [Actinomycetota bacterium]